MGWQVWALMRYKYRGQPSRLSGPSPSSLFIPFCVSSSPSLNFLFIVLYLLVAGRHHSVIFQASRVDPPFRYKTVKMQYSLLTVFTLVAAAMAVSQREHNGMPHHIETSCSDVLT